MHSTRDVSARSTAAFAACVLCVVLVLACRRPPESAGVRTRVDIRVPASVITAHLREHPLLLLGEQQPGTLQHRGFLLGVICSADADVTAEWTMELEGPTAVTVWVERGYANNPNTPCGITPLALRRDLIAEPPAWHPHASAQVVPGQQGVALVIENNGSASR